MLTQIKCTGVLVAPARCRARHGVSQILRGRNGVLGAGSLPAAVEQTFRQATKIEICRHMTGTCLKPGSQYVTRSCPFRSVRALLDIDKIQSLTRIETF